jgi:hypothetical protein
MPKHVSMDPADLITVLDILELKLADLAFLTGTDEDWCARLVKGYEPIPHWLNLLTVYWCADPNAMKLARECAIAMQNGGPATEQLVEDVVGIKIVGETQH